MYDSWPQGNHTTTQMGSGIPPAASSGHGYEYTAYDRNVMYIDAQETYHDASLSYINDTPAGEYDSPGILWLSGGALLWALHQFVCWRLGMGDVLLLWRRPRQLLTALPADTILVIHHAGKGGKTTGPRERGWGSSAVWAIHVELHLARVSPAPKNRGNLTGVVRALASDGCGQPGRLVGVVTFSKEMDEDGRDASQLHGESRDGDPRIGDVMPAACSSSNVPTT